MISAWYVGGALATYLVSLPVLTYVLENAYSKKKQERMWANHYERTTFTEYVSLEEFKMYALKGFDGRTSRMFHLAVAVHNAGLALFSLFLFAGASLVAAQMLRAQGGQSLCDNSMWYKVKFWATLFYWSKYYEFLDTWIIIAKSNRAGKRGRPSVLQVYHHCGVVVCVWATVVTRAPWAIYPVVLNSGVHTFMYSYFFANSFGYGQKMAKFVTSIQLGQCVVGLAVGSWTTFFCPQNPNLRLSCVVYLLYVAGLLVLFLDLFRNKYKSKQKI
jgi:hypothetical protein